MRSSAPLPSEVWAVAATAGYTPQDQRSEQQRSAQALAATLADELIGADAAVIAAHEKAAETGRAHAAMVAAAA